MSAFEMTAGDGKVLEIPVTDAAGGAVNLAGIQAARFVLDAPTPVEKTLGDGVAVADPASAGVLRVTLAAGDTAGLIGVFAFQVQLTDEAGTPSTVTSDDLTLNEKL